MNADYSAIMKSVNILPTMCTRIAHCVAGPQSHGQGVSLEAYVSKFTDNQ